MPYCEFSQPSQLNACCKFGESCGVTSKIPFHSLLADGSDSRDKPKLYRLQVSVTEVGTEKFDDSSIQVRGGAPLLSPFRHSHISEGDGTW